MMMNLSQKLTFFLSEKRSILIVTLIGPLVRSNALVLEECAHEVAKSNASVVILNFRDVPSPMDSSLIPALARIQGSVRKRHGTLRMSGIHPVLRSLLAEAGALHPEEVCDNLSQALQIAANSVSARTSDK